jgi:hypothetical protein
MLLLQVQPLLAVACHSPHYGKLLNHIALNTFACQYSTASYYCCCATTVVQALLVADLLEFTTDSCI